MGAGANRSNSMQAEEPLLLPGSPGSPDSLEVGEEAPIEVDERFADAISSSPLGSGPASRSWRALSGGAKRIGDFIFHW